ncbi:hypothetical protein HA402_006358 [Bradysia odoriphaga]|nr:hypothetical protein HA402_006358 [Bradysia odoriphaga]
MPSKIAEDNNVIVTGDRSVNSENDKEHAIKQTPDTVIHFMVSLRQICLIVAAIPLVTLFLCLIYAIVFQFEDVHETHCRVFNIIPSISAITGISPQRYFWRISVAIHIGPRFGLIACYRSHYNCILDKIQDEIIKKKARLLATIVFWSHTIELSALCGVTYVSNRENYPLHEKIFITFMTCSLCHMLATIKLYNLIKPIDQQTPEDQVSIKWKKRLFASSILSTIGLLIFFFKHRFYCHDMAFSWFALSEYFIACSNMAFHYTTTLDFPNEFFFIGRGLNKLKGD